MTHDASNEERLARLAARGRVRTSDPARLPTVSATSAASTAYGRSTPTPAGSGPWAAPTLAGATPPYVGAAGQGVVYPGPAYAGRVDPASAYPTPGRPPTAPYPGATYGAAARPAPTRRTTSPARPAGGRYHPARRSRLATAGVSTALLFGGIGYLSATQVFANTQPTASQGADPAALTTSGAAADGQSAGDQLGGDDAVPAVAAAEPAGTLPPTVAPASATTPTTLGPAPAGIAPAAADPADPAAAAAPTDPPTTSRRTPHTAAPRPRCTGSHC